MPWALGENGRPVGLNVHASRAAGLAERAAYMAEVGKEIEMLSGNIAKDMQRLSELRESYARLVEANLDGARLLVEEARAGLAMEGVAP